MELVPILVEGVTDRAFLERLPGLEKQKIDFRSAKGGGQEPAKQQFAAFVKSRMKAMLCLDIDDKTPQEKFAELEDYLRKEGIPLVSIDTERGILSTEGGQVLFVPLGLWGDRELQSLRIARHSFEDYLIKIALGDSHLRASGVPRPLRECLEQIVSAYVNKGCDKLSSAQVYQLLKPFMGLPKYETGAIHDLLRRANQDTVREVTNTIVGKLNSFLAGIGVGDD